MTMSQKEDPRRIRRMERGEPGDRARFSLFPPEIPRRLGRSKMLGIDGGIMANRHRAIRPSSRPIIADGNPLFLAPFPRSRWPGDGVPKKGGNRPILIRDYGRKEGPVNCRGVARDVRGYRRGEIMDNRHRAGRPSFRPLISAKDGSISTFFRHTSAGPSASWKWRKK